MRGKYQRKLRFITSSTFLFLIGVILGANSILAINNSPAFFNIAEANRVCIGPDGSPHRCPSALMEGDLSLTGIRAVQAPFGQDKLVDGKPTVLALNVSSSFHIPVNVQVRITGFFSYPPPVGGGIPTPQPAGVTFVAYINVQPGSNNHPIFVPSPFFYNSEQMCVGAKINSLAFTLVEETYANNEIRAGSQGTCYPVISTKPLSVLYIPVVINGDEGTQLTSQEIHDFVSSNDDYLKGSWPLPEGGYRSSIIETQNLPLDNNIFDVLNGIRMQRGFDAVVAVVRAGWMSTYGNTDCGGFTPTGIPVSFIEGKIDASICWPGGINSLLVAHELAHQFNWVASFEYRGPTRCPDDLPARHICVEASGYWVSKGKPMVGGDDFMYPNGWCCVDDLDLRDWISVYTFNYLLDRLRR